MFPGRSGPGELVAGESEEQALIDDRMRGPGNGATTVWVYDERRRVRDDVASRLVALPFVGRVEVVADAASLHVPAGHPHAPTSCSSAPSAPSTPA